MKSNQSLLDFLKVALSYSIITVLFISCNQNKYDDILSMVPYSVENKTEYLKNSINYFNDVNKALASSTDSIFGRPVSPGFANLLHENYRSTPALKEDNIRAITFSYSKILKSLEGAKVIDFDKTEVTIIFGRYPNVITDSILIANNVDIANYNSLRNKLTCILTYRTPGVPGKMRFFQVPPYPYDNVGQPCPPNCSFDPIN